MNLLDCNGFGGEMIYVYKNNGILAFVYGLVNGGGVKSLQLSHLKTGAPSNTNFRRIKQGGYAKWYFNAQNAMI